LANDVTVRLVHPFGGVLAGGEAEFFQSLFEELSNVPLAVDDANARQDCSVVPRCVSEDGSSVSIADVPQQKVLRDSESKCVADQKKSVYSPRRSVEIRY
jgi:hypothetical protein